MDRISPYFLAGLVILAVLVATAVAALTALRIP
jgi:hypothetical protein